MQTREEKIFQRIGHCVMIVLSACAIIPMILLVMSSVTDNNTLISNGYSFSGEIQPVCMSIYIFKTGNAVLQAYGISVYTDSDRNSPFSDNYDIACICTVAAGLPKEDSFFPFMYFLRCCLTAVWFRPI